MILLYTDVFQIDQSSRDDSRYPVNRQFLDKMKDHASAATTIFNVLEFCHNLMADSSPEKAKSIFKQFDQIYRLQVLYPISHDLSTSHFLKMWLENVFEVMLNGVSVVDALNMSIAEDHQVKTLVTWDVEQLKKKTKSKIHIMTPEEFQKMYDQLHHEV